jgi:hypothetical protein
MPSNIRQTKSAMNVAATMVQQYFSLRCLAAVCMSHCSQCSWDFGLNTPARVCTRLSGGVADVDATLSWWS